MENKGTPTTAPNQFDPHKTAQLSPTGTLTSNQANAGPINIQEQPIEPVKIFISYVHADRELREKLEEHLAPLKHLGKIDIWQDQQISAGSEWDREIQNRLKDADMILLLVSASFIASNYCWDEEVQKALERHEAGTSRVIPIILKPALWQDTPLGKLQALPRGTKPVTQWKDPEEALENVAQGIRSAVEHLQGENTHFVARLNKIIHYMTTIVPTSSQGSRPLPQSLLLISAILLFGYLLSVGLNLFNIALPFWMSYTAPLLAVPFVFLLFVEARKTHRTVKIEERRVAILSISAFTIGLLSLGSFVQRMGQLTQLRMALLPGKSRVPLFENILSNRLGGIPVSSLSMETYEETINALAKGDVEVGWLGPFSYLRAYQHHGVRAILCNLTLDKQKKYQSYIIANAKANIRVVQDLKGRPFALVDPNSASGNVIPRDELKKAKIDPSNDIKVTYVGSHENVLAQVLEGKFPAGAVKSELYESSKGGTFQESDLVILIKSRDIPKGPLTVRKDIHRYDELRIEDALLTVAVTEPDITRSTGDGGFAKVVHKDYEFLLDIAKELGIDIASLD